MKKFGLSRGAAVLAVSVWLTTSAPDNVNLAVQNALAPAITASGLYLGGGLRRGPRSQRS